VPFGRDKLRKGWQDLIAADSNNDSARADLAVCDSETSVTLLKLDPPKAVAMAAGALATFEQIERARPDDTHLGFRRARGATRLALTLLAAGRPGEALLAIQSSLRTHRDLLAKAEDNPSYRRSLVWTLTVTGRVERALGHDDQARIALEEAIRLAEPLAGKLDLPSLRMSTEAYEAYGEVVGGEKRCQSARRAQEAWDAWSGGSSPWVDARRKQAAQLVATCLSPRP
jgi:tetratricopeptide (TPR) repeat protein